MDHTIARGSSPFLGADGGEGWESMLTPLSLCRQSIMSEMEAQYRAIEQDTQAYFAAYIKRLNDAAAQRAAGHTELVAKLSDEALQYRTVSCPALSSHLRHAAMDRL